VSVERERVENSIGKANGERKRMGGSGQGRELFSPRAASLKFNSKGGVTERVRERNGDFIQRNLYGTSHSGKKESYRDLLYPD